MRVRTDKDPLGSKPRLIEKLLDSIFQGYLRHIGRAWRNFFKAQFSPSRLRRRGVEQKLEASRGALM